MTIRRSGPRPHQLRGSDPGGCDADHGPERRTANATQGGEHARSGRAKGEARSAEGAPPPGAPSGALGDASATRELADAVRGLARAIDAVTPRRVADSSAVTWNDTDAQFARAVGDGAPRPIATKTPAETAILTRMRARRPKDRPA